MSSEYSDASLEATLVLASTRDVEGKYRVWYIV